MVGSVAGYERFVMSTGDYLSAQNLMILGTGLLVAIFALGFFLRKRSNRHPLEGQRERNVAADLDAGRKAPDHLPGK